MIGWGTTPGVFGGPTELVTHEFAGLNVMRCNINVMEP